LLLLHGTGGSETDLLPIGDTLAPTFNQLSPAGRVMEGPMRRFFRRYGEGQFDEASIREESAALAEFVDWAADEYGFDASRVYGVGFSNGANIAGSLLLLHPTVLAGGMLMRPMLPLEPPEVPDLRGKKVLTVNGEQDEMAPVASVERLHALLREGGAELEAVWHGGGHGLTRGELSQGAGWFGALG
jgi:predicted esterase